MSGYEKITGGGPWGTVWITQSADTVCDYCGGPAAVQFRFREQLRLPAERTGCIEHAGLAAMGAYEASLET